MALSMRQIAAHVLAAGFAGERAAEAVAIAWAESTGDPKARNSSSGTRGLWQIHPYWHREVSDECAYDPACAARQAYRISNGGADWSPWTTWPGAASAYLARARRAVGSPAAGGGTTPAGWLPPLPGAPWAPLLPDWFPGLPGDGPLERGREWAEGKLSAAASEAAAGLVRAAAPAVLTGALVLGGVVIVWVGVAGAVRATAKAPKGAGADA